MPLFVYSFLCPFEETFWQHARSEQATRRRLTRKAIRPPLSSSVHPRPSIARLLRVCAQWPVVCAPLCLSPLCPRCSALLSAHAAQLSSAPPQHPGGWPHDDTRSDRRKEGEGGHESVRWQWHGRSVWLAGRACLPRCSCPAQRSSIHCRFRQRFKSNHDRNGRQPTEQLLVGSRVGSLARRALPRSGSLASDRRPSARGSGGTNPPRTQSSSQGGQGGGGGTGEIEKIATTWAVWHGRGTRSHLGVPQWRTVRTLQFGQHCQQTHIHMHSLDRKTRQTLDF